MAGSRPLGSAEPEPDRKRSTAARTRRAALPLLAALLMLMPAPADAYEALLGWSPVDGVSGYQLQIQFDDQAPSDPIDIGFPPIESDGLQRVVVTDLPVGPLATFTARAYDTLGQRSAPSGALSITYAEVATVIDEDGDGLTNAEEDIDLDRIVDATETDPHAADSDGDGLSDGDEIRRYGTNPLRADTDGDGFSDADELGAGSDPTDATSFPNSGECTAGVGCDDGNPCTDDYCMNGRCIRSSNTNVCDDATGCTSNDRCDGGLCSGTSICDAGWLCEPGAERCAPAEGDIDNDGLVGTDDPCPFDPRNACFGNVATDGNTGRPIRINANTSSVECAGTKTDCAGNEWFADFGYSIAAKAATCDLNGGGEACSIAGITSLFGCEDETTEDLFQCEHADRNTAPELFYKFSVPNGRYLVNLFFANTYTGTTEVGDRLCDIVVEDEIVYGRFDQVEAAGGSAIAVVRSVVADVVDGELLVLLTNRRENNPAIKALEVLRESDSTTTPTSSTTTTTVPRIPAPTSTVPEPDPTPTTTTSTTSTTTTSSTSSTSSTSTTTTLADRSGDFDNDGLSNADDACPSDASNACFGPAAVDQLSGSELRINANPESSFCSGRRTDCRGRVWQEDFGYVEAGKGRSCSGNGRWGRCDIDAVEDTLGCEASATRDLFRCAHSAADSNATLAYAFRVAPGRYLVNLYFANVRWNESDPGSQITDISINGETVYPSFDMIVAAGGPNTLVVRAAYTTVPSNGDLVVNLASVVGRASLNAIEVLRAGPAGSIH